MGYRQRFKELGNRLYCHWNKYKNLNKSMIGSAVVGGSARTLVSKYMPKATGDLGGYLWKIFDLTNLTNTGLASAADVFFGGLSFWYLYAKFDRKLERITPYARLLIRKMKSKLHIKHTYTNPIEEAEINKEFYSTFKSLAKVGSYGFILKVLYGPSSAIFQSALLATGMDDASASFFTQLSGLAAYLGFVNATAKPIGLEDQSP